MSASKKPFRKIEIGNLIIGMHVVGLDISWINSPFFTHSKTIKNDREIGKLKKAGVKIVTIDPNRGKDIPTDQLQASSNLEVQAGENKERAKKPSAGTKSKTLSVPIEKELHVANEIRTGLSRAIKSIQKNFTDGKKIDKDKLTPLIDQTLTSLERNNQALMSLAHVSKRSQKLVDHIFSTFCIAMNIAQGKKLSEKEMEALGLAALLHEVGWTSIPFQIMGKRSPYTSTELRLLHKHPQISVKSLQASKLDDLVIRIILEHHERGDGSGYPTKLTADEIHPVSKILIVADTYDELVHQLRDQPGMLPTNALKTLHDDSEKNIFDRECVSQLIASLGIYPVSTAVALNTGEKGVICEVAPDKHLYPIVELRYDKDREPLTTYKKVNLLELSSGDHPLTIEAVLDPSSQTDDPHQILHFEI